VSKQTERKALEQRVLRFIHDQRLLSAQSPLLVAVSGGADSVCLLHVLSDIKDELGTSLHIAHLNHKLRGEESDADAAYVAELAASLDIPVTVGERDVAALKKKRHISLEEAAREARYAFLAQTADAVGAGEAAVGHTADDHIETVLMHLVRGSGVKGLGGLKPRTEWRLDGDEVTIVRPLLEVSRWETAEYCRQHGLAVREDSTNLSLSPLRNRIRHQLLPLLREYNPQINEALLRTARIADEDLGFIDERCSRLWVNIAHKQGDAVTIDRQGLLKTPPVLRRYLLRMSIEKLAGDIKDIELRHIEDIMAILTKPAGKRLDLPGGLVFATDYDRYIISRGEETLSPYPTLEGEHTLKLPGETAIPGWRIEASIAEPSALTGNHKGDDDFTARLDYAKTGDKLTVRSRRRGDRFQPLGMSQPKKLGEFMIDSRIPQGWRDDVPIVSSPDSRIPQGWRDDVPIVSSPQHIVWVVGCRIDDRAKVAGGTKRILRISFRRV